ncbi:hypothetical protein [Streptomyces sp. YIM S03343]
MTTDRIRPPWTPEQVATLNAFQERGGTHPFTCGNDSHDVSVVLMAHRDGWHCSDPGCDYRQDWAHAFMADHTAWPRFPFGERHGPTPQETRAAVLPVSSAPTPAPAGLRERIADVLADADGWTWAADFDRYRSPAYQAYLTRADKVIAALHADRAAIILDAAATLERMPGYPRLVLPEELMAELRRLAGEAQQDGAGQ